MYYYEGVEGAFGKGRTMRSAPDMQEALEEDNSYKRYRELGGIINEKDYESILQRATSDSATGAALAKQASRIADIAHITPDKRVFRLYRTMRNDTKPAGVKHHHSQMSDQRLFAEALRMVGDADSLDKLISALPNISFN